jgi:GNAT superfamily N-acetyltransferase
VSLDVRPLRPDDVPAAHALSFTTFAVQDAAEGLPVAQHTEERRRWGEARIAAMLASDPAGAWCAVDGDRLVGVALATRRAGLWFLSLLTVDVTAQGAGLGRRLLEATRGIATGATAGLICSSDDPRALHRYGTLGFSLLPAYEARGTVDRSRLPAVTGVRDGSWTDDRERVDALAVDLRGAPLGPDADAFAAMEASLLVADGPEGRGYAVVRPFGVAPVAATTPAAARALLVTGLAAVSGEATVGFVTGRQPWAVDVLLELRLPFRTGGSLAVDRFDAAPYLPSGAFG